MARVNVEEKALTDPRFYRLGLELGADSQFAHAVGLFAMIRIWKECIERGKYTLEGWLIQAVIGNEKAAESVVNSDLATRCAGNRSTLRRRLIFQSKSTGSSSSGLGSPNAHLTPHAPSTSTTR